MNSWKSATISNGCASISFTSAEANSSSCSKPSLRYYLEDESGNPSAEQTVNDIGLRLIIAQIYNYLMNRNARNTSDEIGYWIGSYGNTNSVANIQKSIVNSDEPKNYYNSLSVSDFIRREYRGILGRDAEDGAITSHATNLQSMGNNRQMHLSNAIIDSEEAGKIRQCWSYTAASSSSNTCSASNKCDPGAVCTYATHAWNGALVNIAYSSHCTFSSSNNYVSISANGYHADASVMTCSSSGCGYDLTCTADNENYNTVTLKCPLY